jgi:hypothetical protein
MDRRTFLKSLGALAAMPALGKFMTPLKSEAVREGIATVGNKTLELYQMVVAKVMKEGKIVGESRDGIVYKHPDRPDVKVEVSADGNANIEFDTDQGSRAMAEIRKDPEVGSTELFENEEIYTKTGRDVEEGIRGGIESLEKFTGVKKANGGIINIDLTMTRMPVKNKAGVETLFERR